VENSAGTISMGDPYATPRRQNVVTPWSKKHPDGGSATAQRTGSVTGNVTPIRAGGALDPHKAT
jgi:hypothetical protein